MTAVVGHALRSLAAEGASLAERLPRNVSPTPTRSPFSAVTLLHTSLTSSISRHGFHQRARLE